MTTITKTNNKSIHPSTRGVHYLYLNDSRGRMVGCIATVRRGQKLFLGTSFCSATGGDTFRKSQGRAIAEGRAVRRAEEQEKIYQVLNSPFVDNESAGVRFLTRAQHAMCVDLDLLADCSVTLLRPKAFDVLTAILHSVVEFDSDLDDRMEFPRCECNDGQAARDAETGTAVCFYFAELDIPGGLVRAARRKLNDISTELCKREMNACTQPDTFTKPLRQSINNMFNPANSRLELAGKMLASSPTTVLGPVIPPYACNK